LMTPFHPPTHPLTSFKGSQSIIHPPFPQPSDQPIANVIAAPKTIQKVPSKPQPRLSDETIKPEQDRRKPVPPQPQAHHQTTPPLTIHPSAPKPNPGKPKSTAP